MEQRRMDVALCSAWLAVQRGSRYHLDLLGSSVPHLTANIGAVLMYIFWGL